MRISDWSSDVCSSDLERKARHLVLVGLAPHGFGLRLHATNRAQHEHRAVEHAQRTLDLDREVDVPGSIDDVQAVLRHRLVHAGPERGGRGGRDGDAALLLLLHPVHGGGTVVRSEEHTSELQSLMRISYAVFCLKKKT